MKRNQKKGFTLIELMIVIAIIAILAAILVPNFLKARAQGQLTACKSNLKNIGTAAEMYATDNGGRYPQQETDFTATDAGSGAGGGAYMKSIPMCPAAGDASNYKVTISERPDYFGVQCIGENHKAAGIKTDFPQFDSIASLMEGKEKDNTSSKNDSITTNMATLGSSNTKSYEMKKT